MIFLYNNISNILCSNIGQQLIINVFKMLSMKDVIQRCFRRIISVIVLARRPHGSHHDNWKYLRLVKAKHLCLLWRNQTMYNCRHCGIHSLMWKFIFCYTCVYVMCSISSMSVLTCKLLYLNAVSRELCNCNR